LWRCPVCGRKFAKTNQSHSHAGRTIDSHFANRPEAKIIFADLIKKMEGFGPLRADAVETSINLIAKHHLGGVRVLKNGLRIGFVLARKLADPRILKTEWVGGSKYLHSVRVDSSRDLDGPLLAWLKEAYDRAS
jgi:hypothetical protein